MDYDSKQGTPQKSEGSGSSSSGGTRTPKRQNLRGMSAAQAQAALSPRKKEEEDGGWFGWVGDAADWVGETAGEVADAVVETATDAAEWTVDTASDAADWTMETATDAAEWTMETASDAAEWTAETAVAAKEAVVETAVAAYDYGREAWEAAAGTSLTWNKGVITVTTSLDEAMDLMPAGLKSQLSLDRAAAGNQVTIRLNTNTRGITLSSPSLALTGVKTADLKTGPVTLNGFSVSMSNYGGALSFLAGDFSVFGYKPIKTGGKDTRATASVQYALAKNVLWTGKGGPAAFDELYLEELTGALSTNKKGELVDMSASLETALLKGLDAVGVEIGQVDASGLSVAADGVLETASLTADALRATDAKRDGRSVDMAEVIDARADVTNTGGGLPFVDGKADSFTTDFAVGHAGISGYKADRGGIGSASLSNVTGDMDASAGTLNAKIGDARTEDVNTGWVDIDKGTLTDTTIAAKRGTAESAHSLDINVDKVGIDGVGYAPPEATPDAKTGGSAFPAVGFNLGVNELNVDDIEATEVGVTSANASGISAEGLFDQGDSWFDARAKEGHAYGLSHTYANVDAMHTEDARLRGDAEKVSLTAAKTSLLGMETESVKAAEVTGDGASVDFQKGRIDASLKSAQVTDGLIDDRLAIADADIRSLTASRAGDASSVGFESGTLSGLEDRESGAKLKTLRARGAAIGIDDKGVGANVESASASRFTSDEGTFDNASAKDLTYRSADGVTSVDATKLGLQGTSVGSGFTAQNLDATDLKTQAGADGIWDVSAKELNGEQVMAGERVWADTLATKGVAGRFGKGVADVNVDSADLSNLAVGDQTIDQAPIGNIATADMASLTGISANMKDDGWAYGVDGVKGNRVSWDGRTDMETLNASGVSGFAGDVSTASVAGARATGINDRTSNSTANDITVAGVDARFDDEGTHATVDSLGASKLSLEGGETTLDSLSVGGLKTTVGDVTTGSAANASATGIANKTNDLTIARASLAGLSGRQDASGISGSLSSGTASSIRYGNELSLGSASATGLNAQLGESLLSADVAGLSGTDLRHHGDSSVSSAQTFNVAGGTAKFGDGMTQIGAKEIAATGASNTTRTDVTTDNDASGQPSGSASSRANTDVDMARLIETGSARVQDADISGTAPMNAGSMSVVDILPDTVASGEAKIRDGEFLPGHTSAQFSKALDGPLWVSVDGAYLDKKNKLRGDVSGWGDRNISRDLNQQLGIKGSTMPSVSTLGSAVANSMRPSEATAGSTSDSKGGSSNSSSEVDAANPFNLDEHTLKADMRLNAGEIDAGNAGSVTLGKAQHNQDNVVSVNSSGTEGLTATAGHLLTDDMHVNTGTGSVSAGKGEVTDAELVVLPNGTTVTKAQALNMKDFQYVDKTPAPKKAITME